MYITEEKHLLALCSRLRKVRRIAVDVEFMREKTYYPIMALLQVASGEDCAAIDVLKISSLAPFFEILHDPAIEKVFHAGKQDLEIFFQSSGSPVKNIFDTQVAAALVGLGAQVSLMKLIETAVGARLEKSQSYTNWLQRPLSDCQVAYALDDVRYLLPAQDYLLKNLRDLGREDWLCDEFARLEDPTLYQLPIPEKQYTRVKGYRSLKPRTLAVLRELAAWREREARERNRFLNAVIREESLMVIARQTPKTIQELSLIRGIHPNEVKYKGNAILEAVQRGLAVPQNDCPIPQPPESDGVTNGTESLLWIYAQERAKNLKIGASYLASRKEINELVRFHRTGGEKDHGLLKGWKKKLIGNDLLMILEGKASVGINSKGKLLKLLRK